MKSNDVDPTSVPWKFQLDIALVTAAATFIILRLIKIGLIFISPPGDTYQTAIFWIAYPIAALLWGLLSRPLHYPLWATLLVGLVGFGAGLYYWSGLPSLAYLGVYLPAMAVGYYLSKKLPTKKRP